MSNLIKLRKKIDKIDAGILTSISKHLAISLEIEKDKRKNGVDIICMERKQEKLTQLIQIAKELNPPLNSRLVKNLWEILHDYFVKEQIKQRKKG